MERSSRVKSLVMMCVVLGLLSGEYSLAASTFQQCYGICFITCVLTSANTTFGCAAQCLKDCILTPPIRNSSQQQEMKMKMKNNHNYCKLGCATSMCTNISTKQNPATEKVEGCVKSCDKTCT